MKFFRKLRQQMLGDQKIRKYLLYAIGEITLVVIGILIALQVNNWNEERKEQTELEGYLSNISKNIERDLKQLEGLLEYRSKSKAGSVVYMDLLNKAPIPADAINRYYAEYGNHMAIFEMYFKPDKSGFEALKNSGYLGRLQGSELETKLYKYYELTTTVNLEETSLNDFVETMEAELFKDNIIQRMIPVLSQGIESEEDLALMQELLRHPAAVGVNFRNSHLNTLFQNYENLQNSGSLLIEHINEKLHSY
jgi:hypothetical protein